MKKSCLHCGESFMGRSDKKFCSDYCRATYNNKLNRDNVDYLRSINRTLRKNRRILQKLCKEGETQVSAQLLTYNGFIFNCFTHKHISEEDLCLYFCYEYGYIPLANHQFKLVQKEIKLKEMCNLHVN